MKPTGKLLIALSVLIIASLACNIPNVNLGATNDAPTAALASTSTEGALPTSTTTPTETSIPVTDTPSITPEITLTSNSNCRLGPAINYTLIDQIASGRTFAVIGRNEDNTWWQIVNDTNRECWIISDNAYPNSDFSNVPIGNAPELPGVPLSFTVVNQNCQPGPKKFSVTLSWTSGGGGEDGYRIYRNSERRVELNAKKFNFKDDNAPYNKNLIYEIEAFNEVGSSDRAAQIVPACK